LVFLAFAPLIELIYEWFENAVDDGVQRINGVFTDLTKQNLVVTGVGLVHLFTSLKVSEEVAPLAIELDLLTVGDEELLWTVEVLDIS
jgi:hypothetical protein